MKNNIARLSKNNFNTEIDFDTNKNKIRVKTKNFNEKVRKANMKNSLRRSRDRIYSKDRNNSAKRNFSNISFKNKIKRRLSKPQKTNEKTKCESDEDEYGPQSREIGLDFLEFMPKRKKPNHCSSKLFNSTQKNFANCDKKWFDKPKEKKVRPNSAQNITSSIKFSYAYDTPNGVNEGLDTPVKPIDELPEIPATGRISDVSSIIEEIKNPNQFAVKSIDVNSLTKPKLFSNDEYSVNSKQIEFVYEPNGKLSLLILF